MAVGQRFLMSALSLSPILLSSPSLLAFSPSHFPVDLLTERRREGNAGNDDEWQNEGKEKKTHGSLI